jgi:hypothetical protein
LQPGGIATGPLCAYVRNWSLYGHSRVGATLAVALKT